MQNTTTPPSPHPLAAAFAEARLSDEASRSVRAWLAEQLLADTYAKLSQGGHAESQVPLRRVFVDLPVADRPWGDDQEGRRYLLAGLLRSAPASLQELGEARREVPRSSGSYSATLLIGGPGQGKSTITQLACQLHRAALLKPMAAELTMRQRDLVDSFFDLREDDPIVPPASPCLPLQLALPELAAWLAAAERLKSPEPLALRFLADRPSGRQSGLSAGTLLQLAAHLPALLVLDGLDEVGAASDRARVVEAARELLAALPDTRLQVLATTRPQGYTGELAGLGLKERYLLPLSREEALRYADRLVRAMEVGADERARRLSRLEEAAEEPSSRALMTTPLQVTILTALVQHGRAPRERWRLFFSYFSHVYQREIDRESYASRLLQERRPQIERLHGRVGLLLQVEAEREGGATSRMPRARLLEVVDTVLAEEGIEGDERGLLTADIVKAAESRLVFLVEPEPGAFGFELRSLQEMMAAWALTSGRDRDVLARLGVVARAPLLRNTLLFAASRLFSDGSPLREELPRICREMDDEDALGRLALPGALLALELLEEGSVSTQPKHARALMMEAARLLDLPPSEDHLRLARVVNRDTAGVLREAIEARALGERGLSAWICLVEATNRREAWAIEVGDALWPRWDTKARLVGVLERRKVTAGAWITHKIEESFAEFEVEELADWVGQPEFEVGEGAASWIELVERAFPLWGTLHGYLPLGDASSEDEEPPSVDGSVDPWVAAHQFRVAPSRQRLARALEVIAASVLQDRWSRFATRTGWPLAVCLLSADSKLDLLAYAAKIQSGEFGDGAAWCQADVAWSNQSRWDPEAVLQAAEHLPWSREALVDHPPLVLTETNGGIWQVDPLRSIELLARAGEVFRRAPTARLREELADVCLLLLSRVPADAEIDRDALRAWVEAAPNALRRLLPRPAVIPRAEWLLLLDSAREGGGRWVLHDEVLRQLEASDGHPAVVRCAVQGIIDGEVWEFLMGPATPTPAQGELLERLPKDDPPCAPLLRMFFGLAPGVGDEELLDGAERHPWLWRVLLRATARHPEFLQDRESFLTRLSAAVDPASADATRATGVARHLLQSRRSNLNLPTTWDNLGLPLPRPSAPDASPGFQTIPTTPIILSSLDLRDVRGLHHLHLDLTPPAPGAGQWVVLLGPNGAGKTTLLRAMALACRNLQDLGNWPEGITVDDWIRSGAREAVIGIVWEGARHETVARSNGSSGFFQSPIQERPRLFPLFGYGCRRGPAVGSEPNDKNGPEIATLFKDRADLIHAESWLVGWDGEALRNPTTSGPVFKAIHDAVCALLDISNFNVENRRVWVTEKHGARLPLSALSDGYLTTAGWFLDLIARWVELATQHQVPIGPDFLTHMCGLVLIDEIDLHIHPRWQIEIITRTRRLLPKMSFIATTHNPLTLVGAKAEEIWILSRDEGRVTVTRGEEAPVLLTGGQIYRRYFGIEDIYPDGLGRKLNRYGLLASYAGRSDDEQEEMEALRAELHAADIQPGWEEVPRSQPEGEMKGKSRRSERG